MLNFKKVILTIAILLISFTGLKSFTPMGKTFGIGLMVGEPTGLTMKIWTQPDRAIALSLGNSYLGSFRFGADYLWHFNAFNSNIANLYAGPGLAIGFGGNGGWIYQNDNSRKWYVQNNDVGFGARGVFGLNIVPSRAPLEFFVEIGLLIGISPGFYSNMEGGLGFRFYF